MPQLQRTDLADVDVGQRLVIVVRAAVVLVAQRQPQLVARAVPQQRYILQPPHLHAFNLLARGW